jgi:DNA-binding response OmpR family regulator
MKKILLIDDHQAFRDITASILEMAAYHVTTAADGKTGLELTAMIRPDLVLTDVSMPDVDGYSVLKVLNSNPETADIPVILLTSKNTREDIRKGMGMGADDYITKPFNQLDLLQSVETRLQKRRSIQSLSQFTKNDASEHESRDFLSTLIDFRKTRRIEKKDKVYTEGDYANYVFFLESGKIKTVKADHYGKEFLTEIIEAGNFFGYLPMETDGEHKETALGMESSVVRVIPKSEFLQALSKDIRAAAFFNGLLSRRLMDKELRMLQLAYASVRERLSSAILRHQKNEGKPETGLQGITRDDLANMIGTTKESLVRTLADLRREGSIETVGRNILIRDEAMLKRNTLL